MRAAIFAAAYANQPSNCIGQNDSKRRSTGSGSMKQLYGVSVESEHRLTAYDARVAANQSRFTYRGFRSGEVALYPLLRYVGTLARHAIVLRRADEIQRGGVCSCYSHFHDPDWHSPESAFSNNSHRGGTTSLRARSRLNRRLRVRRLLHAGRKNGLLL